jgi:hypothetical protein
MKTILTMTALFILISGNARAGNQYDACINQEKALKTKEAGDCSGFRYLLDPSSCFKTRKALKEYTDGKCTALGTAEQVDFSTPNIVSEKKGGSAPQRPVEVTPATAVPENKSVAVIPAEPQKSGLTVPPQHPTQPAEPQVEMTCDQVKGENARLKAENRRIESENEQLRKALPR